MLNMWITTLYLKRGEIKIYAGICLYLHKEGPEMYPSNSYKQLPKWGLRRELDGEGIRETAHVEPFILFLSLMYVNVLPVHKQTNKKTTHTQKQIQKTLL